MLELSLYYENLISFAMSTDDPKAGLISSVLGAYLSWHMRPPLSPTVEARLEAQCGCDKWRQVRVCVHAWTTLGTSC